VKPKIRAGLRSVAVAVNQNRRLAIHLGAIFSEILGTFFIFLDCVRLNHMVRILGYTSFDGEPEQFKRWYYHAFLAGFALLLTGIVLQSIALFLEHLEHHGKQRGTTDPQPTTPPLSIPQKLEAQTKVESDTNCP
jgi:hypothetical protein